MTKFRDFLNADKIDEITKLQKAPLAETISLEDRPSMTIEELYKRASDVQKAYFDTYIEVAEKDPLMSGISIDMNAPGNPAYQLRKLHWVSDTFYSPQAACDAFLSAGVDSYNNFDPKMLSSCPAKKVFPGREGSVCVYIECDNPLNMEAVVRWADQSMADEISPEIGFQRGIVWTTKDEKEVYRPEKENIGLIDFDKAFAETPIVRVWWD